MLSTVNSQLSTSDPPPAGAWTHRFAAPRSLLFALALTALWVPVIYLLSPQWSIYEQYSYGWAIPLLCLYLAWRRWHSFSASTGEKVRDEVSNPPAATSAFQLFSFSAFLLLLFPVRVLQEANPLWRAASYALAFEAIAITLLLVYLASGSRAAKEFAFPVCFFLVAIPWPTPVEGFVVQNLTRFNTLAVTEVMNAMAIPAVAHGNIIEVSTGTLGIEEACSGIRSLQTVLMIALFFGEVHRLSAARRVALVVTGFGAAMAVNVLRTSVLVFLAARHGVEVSNHWHDTTGIIALLFCFAAVWAIAAWLARKGTIPNALVSDSQPSTSHSQPSSVSIAHPPSPDSELAREGERPRETHSSSGGSEPLSTFDSRRPTNVAFLCVIVCSVISLIGTELWFRVHERQHVTTDQWTIALPREHLGFHENGFSREVKNKLQFDSGISAVWRNPDGTAWQFFHFRWNPATRLKDRVRVQLAKSHRPEICLPASGWQLQSESASRTIEVAGIPLLFRAYDFSSGGRSLFVFFCVREDSTASGSTGNMRETHSARLRAAWEANRGLGQRVIEIAISGVRDLAEAESSLRHNLPNFIHISTEH